MVAKTIIRLGRLVLFKNHHGNMLVTTCSFHANKIFCVNFYRPVAVIHIGFFCWLVGGEGNFYVAHMYIICSALIYGFWRREN